MLSLSLYIMLALVLFSIGSVIVIVRKSMIIALLGVELMLNSANLAFIAFARILADVEGQVTAFFVMIVAAAEVVVGLAIIVAIYKARVTTDMDQTSVLKN